MLNMKMSMVRLSRLELLFSRFLKIDMVFFFC